MKDYKKLPNALRCPRKMNFDKDACAGCEFLIEYGELDNGFCACDMAEIDKQAADAIEEMSKHISEMHEAVTRLQMRCAENEPKHGEWKATEMYMTDECTACGFLMNWEDVPECLFNLPHFKDTCPNCGARMWWCE